MNHIQITILASEEAQELLIAELSNLSVGFEQNEESLIAYFEEANFNSYEVLQTIKGFEFTQALIAKKNWNEEWEKDFQPVVVDDFCAVRAHFHAPIPNVDNEIIITPKMSFGTGHHATTYMMMQQMKDIDFKDKSVLDFGTGTGVLAILAEKLGAHSVLAIDNDDWSVKNALENSENNGCTQTEIIETEEIPDKFFDVILANINRNIILQYLPQLKKALKHDGYILFSGLLTSDEQTIVEACEKHSFKFLKQTERTNWIALLFVNGN